MKPVLQDKFYDPDAPPNHQRGNCLTAVVASLLELPLADVPNFVQDHVDHMDEHERGGDWDWWTRLHRFLKNQGYQMHYLKAHTGPMNSMFPDPDPGEFYTVSGISPRDPRIYHIVIYQDGLMVHDPHPEGTGLANITDDYHWSVRPLEKLGDSSDA